MPLLDQAVRQRLNVRPRRWIRSPQLCGGKVMNDIGIQHAPGAKRGGVDRIQHRCCAQLLGNFGCMQAGTAKGCECKVTRIEPFSNRLSRMAAAISTTATRRMPAAARSAVKRSDLATFASTVSRAALRRCPSFRQKSLGTQAPVAIFASVTVASVPPCP